MSSSSAAAAAAAAAPGARAPSSSDSSQRARKRPKIRRTTFACARCHRRKIKCDGLKPACSNCVQAKQPCNGILDGETKTVIPRSIAQYLQEKIQEKELLLRKLGIDTEGDPQAPPVATLPPVSPSVEQQQASRQPVHRFDLATEASRSFGASLSKKLLISQARFPYGTFLFASSHLPTATPATPAPVEEVKEDYFKSKSGSNALEQIPKDVTERLVRNYIERISPLYPFLDRQGLWAQYNAVAQKSADASDYDVFVVSMMIAISIMTSKFSDAAKIASSSERIFQHALNHSDALYETSFKSLQGILFLIQYSYLMPRAASVWDIVGLAMRMALELGLHRDPDEMPGHTFTEAEVELRRCVFWVLYVFDRSICATSHRRLGIADESISTKYPSGMEGTYFINNIYFRRIQSELWTVNYLRRGLPLLTEDGSYEAWVEDIEHRMLNWRSNVTERRSNNPEWYDIAVWHGFVFLHRPCPRNPDPPVESLIKCFEAATEVAAGYWENAHSGFLKYSWHAVHHGFEAAIAMLYALRHCKEQLKERYGTRKILETVHLFSSLFVLMSERWSQAHASLESYERCKGVVMRELMQPGVAPPVAENDELDRMILPQQARKQKQKARREDSGSSTGRIEKREREEDASERSSASCTPSSEPGGAAGAGQAVPPPLQRQLTTQSSSSSFLSPHSSITAEPGPVLSNMASPNNRSLPILPASPSPFSGAGSDASPQPGGGLASHQHMPSSLPTLPSQHMSWPVPHHLQQHQQQHQQAPVFTAGGGGGPGAPPPPPEFQHSTGYEGYDMWTAPGQQAGAAVASSSNMDWDEMVIQPDQSGVDGMILWSM